MAMIITIPSFFSPALVSAAVLNAPTLKLPASDQVLTNYPRTATFSWNSVSGADRYDLEIACDVCVSKTNKWLNATNYNVSGTSFTVKVPGADNQFRWRVRAYSGSTAGNWSSYRYFKYNTAPQSTATTIGKPILYSPTSGQYVNTSNVTFDWSDVSNAVQYTYAIEKYNESASIWQSYASETITPSYKDLYFSGNSGTSQFRFRVRAISNESAFGAWTDWRNFYYVNGGTGYYGTPSINNPTEDQIFTNRNVYISWTNLSGATSYEVNVNYKVGSNWTNQDTYTASQNNTSLYFSYDNNYRLRVRANFGSGNYGSWSGWREFVVNADTYSTTAPTVYSPAQNAVVENNNYEAYLSWGSVSGASEYIIEINRDGYGVQTLYAGTNTSYTFTGAVDTAWYHFRVRARLSGTNYTDWSDYRYFQYRNAGGYSYDRPSVNSPTEDQILTNRNVYMNWTTVSGATSYEVNVNYKSGSNWVDQGTYSSNQNYYNLYFYYDNNYRMRVRAKFSGSSYSDWSDWREFVVDADSYSSSAPTIYNPTQNAAINQSSRNVTLNWSTISDASYYEIQTSCDWCSGGSTEWLYSNTYSTYSTAYIWYTPGSDNMLRFKVRAYKTDDTFTPWTDWRTFHYFQTGL